MNWTFIELTVVTSIFFWYIVATPWFCRGICCLFHSTCSMVVAHGSLDDEKFKPLVSAFEDSLTRGWDLGASLFVAVDGNPVVNEWGGFRDRDREEPYEEDTMGLIFSSGKVIETIAMAMLVDRGLIELNRTVGTYWPEFAQKNKQDITIQDMLSHRSGSSTLFEITPSVETLKDPVQRDVFLASQKFFFPRGTVSYRGWGSGLYSDAICRRVDAKNRSLAKFVQEELFDPLQEEYACPPINQSDKRFSEVHNIHLWTILLGLFPQVFLPGVLPFVLGTNHPFSLTPEESNFLHYAITSTNNPESPFAQPTIPDMENNAASYNNHSSFLAYEMVSSNCFSNARGIGRVMDAFFQGEIVESDTLQEFDAFLPTAFDHFFLANLTYTAGGLAKTPSALIPISGHYDCTGWAGIGGSVLQHCRVKEHVVTFAYVPNGLSPRLANERGSQLLEQTLQLVEAVS